MRDRKHYPDSFDPPLKERDCASLLFKDEIKEEQARLKKEQEQREVRHQAAIQKAQERINTEQADSVEAFKQNYPVGLALERYGYM